MVAARRSGNGDTPEGDTPNGREDEETETLFAPRLPALSVGALVNLFQKQSSDGRSLNRFNGAGSREKVQSNYEEWTDRLITSTSDFDDLFLVVHKIIRRQSSDSESAISESSMGSERLRRTLYSFLKVVLAPPASLILSQSNLQNTLDGIQALSMVVEKYEPLKKTAFRKELILDVILLNLSETSHPEPMILKWLKAIDHLKSAGCTSLEDLLKDILMTALPPVYSGLITIWDSSEEGASAVDKDKMVREICTHFEHVVLPATPVGRKSAHSAANRSNRRGEDRPLRRDPRRDPKRDSPRGNPKGKDGKLDREKSKQASAASQSLKDAQKRQKDHENTEKYKNRVCWVCGKKGHLPTWSGCEKHPDHAQKSANAVSIDEDQQKSGMSTSRIISNKDGHVSFSPSKSATDPWDDEL